MFKLRRWLANAQPSPIPALILLLVCNQLFTLLHVAVDHAMPGGHYHHEGGTVVYHTHSAQAGAADSAPSQGSHQTGHSSSDHLSALIALVVLFFVLRLLWKQLAPAIPYVCSRYRASATPPTRSRAPPALATCA